MEHIVQFAIGIDDEKIKKQIEESAEKQIVERFYKDFTRAIKKDPWSSIGVDPGLISKFNDMAKEAVSNIVSEHKNEIIKEAATILADRLFRTKVAKELLGNIEVKEK